MPKMKNGGGGGAADVVEYSTALRAAYRPSGLVDPLPVVRTRRGGYNWFGTTSYIAMPEILLLT
jgi:hypothetical protein